MSPFFTIALIQLLGLISPGPDFAIIVKNALFSSRKNAIYMALGIAIGILVHSTYCILGLAVVISHSKIAFNIIKGCGSIYLIYMGIKAILEKPHLQDPNSTSSKFYQTTWQAFLQGLFCNILNPKATLFILGIFTLVVQPHTPIYINLAYALQMFLMTFLWFTLLAFIISHRHIKEKIHRAQHYITKFLGIFLIIFGCKLAWLT